MADIEDNNTTSPEIQQEQEEQEQEEQQLESGTSIKEQQTQTDTTTTTTTTTAASYHPSMQEIINELERDFENMNRELREAKTCVKDPIASPDEPRKAGLRKLELELESEIEALMESPLVTLPDATAIHMSMATEMMAEASDRGERTLQFYKNRVEELKHKRNKYSSLIEKAEAVDQKLNQLLTQRQSDQDTRVALEKTLDRQTKLFRCLRRELHFILETFNTEELPTPESIKTMEDLLEALVSQLLEDPNNPYIQIEEETEEGHINLLLAANLIRRHPTDITRVRFVDPRV